MSEEEVSQPFKGQSLSKLINTWSQVDPAGALTFLEKNPATPGTDPTKLLQNWGGLDPEAALGWLANNPMLPNESGSPVALYDSVFTGWLVSDALAAANYVAQHLDVPEVRSSLGRATWAVQQYEPESFDSWITGLADDETRTEAIKGASEFAAPTDPAAIARWVTRQPIEEHGDALRLPLTLWLEKDSEAALKWVDGLPTPVRDSAIEIVCRNAILDRRQRLQLAQLVANHERRVSTLAVLLHEWFSDEPASAKAWLQQSGLPNEDKATLFASEKDAD